MKISKMHIENFGKLSNVDLSFTEGINEIYNHNGWGKTSLSIFLKSMFYGMAASRDNIKNERKKYMPWQGGNFGGYIEFVCDKGSFRLTRYFAKSPEGDYIQLLNLDTKKEEKNPKEGLGEWIFGVGKDTFEMTAFFPQLKFLASTNEQISAGVLGLDKFKYDMASVGDAIRKIKKEISSLKKLSVKQSEIDRLKRQLTDLKMDLGCAQNGIEKVNFEIENQNSLLSSMQNDLEKEKCNFEQQEKVFGIKAKLETEIQQNNEKLSSLLLQLNALNAQKECPTKSKKSSVTLILIAVVLAAIPILLAAFNIMSWIIGISVAVSIALIGGIAIYFAVKKRDKKFLNGEAYATSEDLKKEVEFYKSQLASLKENYKEFDDVNLLDKDCLQTMQNKLFNAKIELERKYSDQKNLLYQYERLLQEIDALGDDIHKKSSQNQDIDEKIYILEQTGEYLARARENVSARFVGPINQHLSQFLEKFDMRGRTYVVDSNFDIKEDTSSGVKAFEHSSQGYQDILSFCMRFLLIKEVYKKDSPFVVLDDTFVNLDDQNFERAKDILKEFSRDYQIIYICCNNRSRL